MNTAVLMLAEEECCQILVENWRHGERLFKCIIHTQMSYASWTIVNSTDFLQNHGRSISIVMVIEKTLICNGAKIG
jgi:hypothetical protein